MLRRFDITAGPAALAVATGLVAAILATGLVIGGLSNTAVPPAAMAALLTLITLPIIRWATLGEPELGKIALIGLGAKAGGTLVRIVLTGDASDALLYNRRGAQIAEWLQDGMVWPNEMRVQGGGHGTTNLGYAVGWLYRVIGVDRYTGYVVFSFMSFVGVLLVFRAAIIAIPQLDRRRYALLLFLLPSLLFWPSSLGKDAWMLAAIGITMTGIMSVLSHRLSVTGLASLIVGLLMAGWIRPHVAALATVALLVAFAWPSRIGRHVVQQIIGLLIAFVILIVALDQVAHFFGSERFEVADVLDKAENVTAQGGSEFTPTPVTNPISFFPGLITVIFRPFPFEASSILQLITSFEAVAVLGLAAVSGSRLRAVPRSFASNGMVRFGVVYLIGFIVAFSVISNFGILARQRAQMWPFLLMLVSLQPLTGATAGSRRRRVSPGRSDTRRNTRTASSAHFPD